jgi:hypothetical protein
LKAGNLFDLTLEERTEYLRLLDDLMEVRAAWEELARVRPQVEPYFPQVARRIADRMGQNPLTRNVVGLEAILTRLAELYFSLPRLDAEFLEIRAQLGRSYLEAGHTPATLMVEKGLWVEEWSRTFQELFSGDPVHLARLIRALALVTFFNVSLVIQQFTHESEVRAREMEERMLEKFLRVSGISRELYGQMARVAGED